MLHTNRLRIYPASREQMEAMIASEQEEELKKAYTEMLEGCLRHPDQWDWYVLWMIEMTDGTHIGDLSSRGSGKTGSRRSDTGSWRNTRGRAMPRKRCGRPAVGRSCTRM